MNNLPADRNRRVLVIDDNRSIHDDFRKILSPCTSTRPALDASEAALFGSPAKAVAQVQFEVESAYQGQEGVMLVKRAVEEGRPYAVAFVDVRMPPGWDGVETTQVMWEIDPDIQVVICTAYSDYSWNDLFATLGHRDGLLILKKPFDTVEALQLAHALTEKWWLHQQSMRKLEELERRVGERTGELRQSNEALQMDVAERKRAEDALRQGLAKVEASRRALLSVAEDQKRTEEKLAKANEELRTALREVQKHQAQMVREERLSALGQMASGIAHDFNNVLVPIVGYSEMLFSHPEMLDNREESLSLLKDINTAAHDAKQIVQRLRLIRGSEGKGEFVPVDVNEMARSAVEMTRPRWDKEMGAKGNRINIVTLLGSGQQTVGNESELREALINLILNAVDAMPKGGALTVSSRVKDEYVVVEVLDAGTGMTDEAKQHCLEPFFTTKGLKGTGLGLSMVYGIVTRHNGTMEIDSTLGRGTTVRMVLPCAPAEPVAKEPQKGKTLRLRSGQAEEDFTVAPLRILVADDEAKSRDLIERFLKKDRHFIETARTGREAIDKANAGTFDLVITDRSMPEANGDLVALSVKARTPETPVILLTGFGDIMKDEHECPTGVDRILTKPITRHELRRAIVEIMGKRE